MSPLWRSRLEIVISPEYVTLTKFARGLKPKVENMREIMIDASSPFLAQPMLEKLSQVLAEPELRADEVAVVLSNKLVRFAAIPANPQLKTYAEQIAFSRHILTQTYGSIAAGWELRLHRQEGNSVWVVAAVDRSLIDGIRQIFISLDINLHSISPAWVTAFNQFQKAFQSEVSWFVMNDNGYSLITLLDAAKVRSIVGVHHRDISEIPTLLDRENLASSLPSPCHRVLLYASKGGMQMPAGSPYTMEFLKDVDSNLLGYRERLFSMLGSRRKVTLDFGRAADGTNRRAGWALLLISLVLFAEMSFSYIHLYRQKIFLQKELETSHTQAGEDVAHAPVLGAKELDAVKTILARLNAPWEELFSGIESIKAKDVAILSVVPDLKNGILLMDGETRNYAALLTLIAQLQRVQTFQDVHLLRYEIKQNDTQHPIAFTISLRQRGLS